MRQTSLGIAYSPTGIEDAANNCTSSEVAALNVQDLQRLDQSAVVDAAGTFALLGNAAILLLGPITALLVATHLSPTLQGFYYTFGSLAVLQTVIEFGFGQAFVQLASYEWSGLGFDMKGRITGDPDAFSRLTRLARLSFIWYSVTAVLILFLLAPGGAYFFSRAQAVGTPWLWPWLVLCIGIALNALLTPLSHFLQGCNRLREFWFYRFIQQIINAVSLWVAILLGAGLWSLPIAMAAGLIWSAIFLRKQPSGFLGSVFSIHRGPNISWLVEVWPIQWRIAIGWFSTQLVILLFAPILFFSKGPVSAGQMGMAATLSLVLIAISSNWVVTKVPRFCILVARQQYRELDCLFFKSFSVGIVAACCGAVGMWLSIYLLGILHHPLASRILSAPSMAVFLLTTILNASTIPLAVYLQAHKRDALAPVFLVSASLSLTLACVLGSRYGSNGITAAYLIVIGLVQFPLCAYVFIRFRSQWHHGKADDTADST